MRGNAPGWSVRIDTEQLSLRKRAAVQPSSGCDGWKIIAFKKHSFASRSCTLIGAQPRCAHVTTLVQLLKPLWHFFPSGNPPRRRKKVGVFFDFVLQRYVSPRAFWSSTVARTFYGNLVRGPSPDRWDPNRQPLAKARRAAGSRRQRHPRVLPPEQPVTTCLQCARISRTTFPLLPHPCARDGFNWVQIVSFCDFHLATHPFRKAGCCPGTMLTPFC